MDRVVAAVFVGLLVGCSAIVNPNIDRLGDDPEVDGGAGCAAGFEQCGMVVCVDLQSDPAHCGGCGFACLAGVSCIAGICECPAGDPACVGVGDPDACGPRMLSCAPDRLCIDGACRCRPGLTDVGGGCTDLESDPRNCGALGNACDEVCFEGACRSECPRRTRVCGDACVPQSDPRHCGGCNRACASDEVCVSGDCRDYETASCNMCPCPDCDEDICCSVGSGAICVRDDECPMFR